MSRLSEEESSKIMDYFVRCVERLRLPAVVPHLMDERSEEGVAAEVTRRGLHVELKVGTEWETYGEGYKREVLFHEAAHLLPMDMVDAIWAAVPSRALSSDDRARIQSAIYDHCEIMTQRIEQIGIERGILPAWPTEWNGTSIPTTGLAPPE